MRTSNERANTNRPVAIDLFCGAGGLSFGLEKAGFDVRLGLDNDKHALASYSYNHSGAALLADVREISGADLLSKAGVSHVDLLAGGPSCQGFSTHGKRLADDPRNFLYKEFMRIVDEIRPTTVLIENVKGMLISGKGAFRREVEGSFDEMGYHVDARVLLAADFGVPQLRERVFFVASKVGSDLKLPVGRFAKDPTSEQIDSGILPHRTVHDALSDLPHIGVHHRSEPSQYLTDPLTDYQKHMRQSSDAIWNHVSRPLSPLALSVIEHLGPGQGLRSLPPEKLPERFNKMRRIANGQLRRDCTTLYHRLSPSRPSYTITCYFTNVSAGAFTHPFENRSITPREAARLQSFPDCYKFVGASIPRQIGNAVPPLLAEAVGAELIEHLALHAKVAA